MITSASVFVTAAHTSEPSLVMVTNSVAQPPEVA